MTNYRRADLPDATYFFTVNLIERKGNTLLTDHIDELRTAFRPVKEKHPFYIDAVVILPEHLHYIWTLPPGDAAFSMPKDGFHALSNREKDAQKAESDAGNAACGNVDFGSMLFGMTRIYANISIIFIGIRLNMDG